MKLRLAVESVPGAPVKIDETVVEVEVGKPLRVEMSVRITPWWIVKVPWMAVVEEVS